MAPHAALNTSELSEKARRDLLRLLEGVRGKKNLVIEQSLAGPIGLFVKFSTLQEYGVDKLFFLENGNVDSSQRNVIFVARSEKSKHPFMIAEQIKKLRDAQSDYEFSILWVPRRTLASNQILEEEGVLGEANISDYPLRFIPLAEDLLSLEMDDAFGDLYLRKDPTCIFSSAQALMNMQQKHGLFPRIIGKGDNAKRLADLLIRMRLEINAGEDSLGNDTPSNLGLTPSASLESLIIIDREVDLPTVLMTQLTYEGLIDEVFGINSNKTEVDSSVIGATPTQSSQGSSSAVPQGPQSLKRTIQLDSSDALYTNLQDANFAGIGPLLGKVARRLKNTEENRHTAAKSTAELRDFVSKLPGYQAEKASLKIHTNLAEEITKYTRSELFSRVLEVQQNIAAGADPSTQHDNVDELISRATPLPTILRLLCLESCMSNGLRPRDLETFKRAVLHAYGHQHLLTLSSLEKAGLLQPRIGGGGLVGTSSSAASYGKTTHYTSVRKTLSLWTDQPKEEDPEDISYAYSGYAPLSVRLVQCILQKDLLLSLSRNQSSMPLGKPGTGATGGGSTAQGWRPFDDVLKQIRGATVDRSQSGEEKAVRARQMLNGGGAHAADGKTIVVFFLGGICRAEVAALRFVARQLESEGRGRRVLVATTGVVSGEKVVGAAIERGVLGKGK